MAVGARLRRERDGSVAVESACLLPVLLLVILGTMELGRIAWTQAALTFAVQEAARCASVRPGVCGAPDQTAAYAAQKVAVLGIAASAFTATAQACGIQVRARVTHRFVFQSIFPAAPTLAAEVCRP